MQSKHDEKSVDKMNEYAKLLTTGPPSGSPSAPPPKKDVAKKAPKAYEKRKTVLESFATELRQ